MSEEKNIHYYIGKRDAIAELFACIRRDGQEATLKDFAQGLLTTFPHNPNPHAKWFLENSK